MGHPLRMESDHLNKLFEKVCMIFDRQNRWGICLIVFCKCIEFGKFELDAENIRHFVLFPVAVGGEDKRAVRQNFDAGISAVGAFGVVFQADMVLPFFALHEIVISADPGDPVPFGGSGMTFGSFAAERNQQSPVGSVFAGMAIAV